MVDVVIKKSEIPIVWLDTSVITNMTIWKSNPDKLEAKSRDRISRLYTLIRSNVREGKIICPLASQEGEVWVNRNEWLDTIYDLGLAIECAGIKRIKDNQELSAMKAYINKSGNIFHFYEDAFLTDPVEELRLANSRKFIISARRNILFGKDYVKEKKEKIIYELNKQRLKNVANAVSYDRQFELELMGDIEAKIVCMKDFEKGVFANDEDRINAYFGRLSFLDSVDLWSRLNKVDFDQRGYLEFCKSEYYKKCPYNYISARMFAKLMVDPQPIRSGDPMDVEHAASLMPYSDLFITDKAWSKFINDSKISNEFATTVCYIGDDDKIEKFFEGQC